MKFKNKFSVLALAITLTAVLACGGSSSENSNTKNSNSPNRAKANNSSSDTDRDMSPVSITISELGEKHIGREVTLSGVKLKEINPTYLSLVGDSGAFQVRCEGEFNQYMSSAGRISDLAKGGISQLPSATIKGIFKEQQSVSVIRPCILVDMKR